MVGEGRGSGSCKPRSRSQVLDDAVVCPRGVCLPLELQSQGEFVMHFHVWEEVRWPSRINIFECKGCGKMHLKVYNIDGVLSEIQYWDIRKWTNPAGYRMSEAVNFMTEKVETDMEKHIVPVTKGRPEDGYGVRAPDGRIVGPRFFEIESALEYARRVYSDEKGQGVDW